VYLFWWPFDSFPLLIWVVEEFFTLKVTKHITSSYDEAIVIYIFLIFLIINGKINIFKKESG
jgi:hypothetical protein